MKTRHILPLASLTFVSVAFSPRTFAAPPASCAIVNHGGKQVTDKNITYTSSTISTPDHKTSLSIGEMSYTISAAASATDLQDQADAASLLLVSAMVGHHNAACSAWLKKQGQAIATGLEAGQSYNLTWSNASISHQKTGISLSSAALSLSGKTGEGNAAASLAMQGLAYKNIANQDLLPESAHAAFSLPSSELPGLMAAIGGKTKEAPAVHVTISDLSAQNSDITLGGHGSAVLTGNVDATSAEGHLEIQNIESLIQKVRAIGQLKLAAALVMARFVSHRESDGGNAWNATWSGGILTVNGIPLPIK